MAQVVFAAMRYMALEARRSSSSAGAHCRELLQCADARGRRLALCFAEWEDGRLVPRSSSNLFAVLCGNLQHAKHRRRFGLDYARILSRMLLPVRQYREFLEPVTAETLVSRCVAAITGVEVWGGKPRDTAQHAAVLLRTLLCDPRPGSRTRLCVGRKRDVLQRFFQRVCRRGMRQENASAPPFASDTLADIVLCMNSFLRVMAVESSAEALVLMQATVEPLSSLLGASVPTSSRLHEAILEFWRTVLHAHYPGAGPTPRLRVSLFPCLCSVAVKSSVVCDLPGLVRLYRSLFSSLRVFKVRKWGRGTRSSTLGAFGWRAWAHMDVAASVVFQKHLVDVRAEAARAPPAEDAVSGSGSEGTTTDSSAFGAGAAADRKRRRIASDGARGHAPCAVPTPPTYRR